MRPSFGCKLPRVRWLALALLSCSASGLDEAPEPEAPERPNAPSSAAVPTVPATQASEAACGAPGARCADERRLSICEGGVERVETCARGCQPMPSPAPARCARGIEPPDEVLRILSSKPYVEDRCAPDEARPGALSCRYKVMGLDAEVVTRSPPPEVVARWIVDASSYAEPIDALFEADRARWAAALAAVARHVKNQSSRIFPVAGTIVEDLGTGPRAFGFDRGVVSPCDEGGCACRINSIKPETLCRYRDALGTETGAACRARLGGPSAIEAWRAACAANHEAALVSESNDHFRAAAWDLGRRVGERCAAGCDPAELVVRVERALGLKR